MKLLAILNPVGSAAQLFSVVFLSACGEVVVNPPVRVATVDLSADSIRAFVGDTIRLTATARDADGNVLTGEQFTWSTNDSTIARAWFGGWVEALGYGAVTVRATAAGVAGEAALKVDKWASVAAGTEATCALTLEGEGYCWGDNLFGGLGVGPAEDAVLAPTPLAGTLRFIELTRGGLNGCGVTTGNQAYCWGNNFYGQLGDSAINNVTMDSPHPVSGGHAFASIHVPNDYDHVCGLTTTGQAMCWGNNAWGQLGDSSMLRRRQPVFVAGDRTFVQVVTGYRAGCGLENGGDVYCWGVGPASAYADAPYPVLTASGLGLVALASFSRQTCGLTATGIAYCWGSFPAQVGGAPRFARISTSRTHSCAIDLVQTAYCWGVGANGRLGTGTLNDYAEPEPLATTLRFTEISVGLNHSCGVTTSGGLFCWGAGSRGQLGTGMVDDRWIPAKVFSP